MFALRDEQYAVFSARLIPNIRPETIIGVRSPDLRRIARECGYSLSIFGNPLLPHRWHEENMLHAYIICGMKNFGVAFDQTELFLPFVTNWAVCDSLSPKTFARNAEKLSGRIAIWLSSPHEYTVRFGISMLMRHFLDIRFRHEYLQWVASIERDEYYIRMMQAWYFATALAKRWDETMEYLRSDALGEWVRRKSIQKALESFRIGDRQKDTLRSLR